MQSFGFGEGRIVSRYPKSWQRRVWNAFEGVDGVDDLDRARLTELLARLSERMVQRCNIHWEHDPTTWLENAEREHARRSFRAILARANPRNHADVLTETAVDEDNVSGWAVSHGRPVARNAAEAAEALAPLLRCSSTVISLTRTSVPSARDIDARSKRFSTEWSTDGPARTQSVSRYTRPPSTWGPRRSFEASARRSFPDVFQKECGSSCAG